MTVSILDPSFTDGLPTLMPNRRARDAVAEGTDQEGFGRPLAF